MKLLYAPEVAMEPYPLRYVTPQFQNFDGRRGNTKDHVACFLDSMGAHPHNAALHEEILQVLDRSALDLVCQYKTIWVHD